MSTNPASFRLPINIPEDAASIEVREALQIHDDQLVVTNQAIKALNTKVETVSDAGVAEAAASAQAAAVSAQAAEQAAAAIESILAEGLSVTIVTAALTPTGTQGSMTFSSGILTAQVPAT